MKNWAKLLLSLLLIGTAVGAGYYVCKTLFNAEKYSVTIQQCDNGEISASKLVVKKGGMVTFTMTADEECQLFKVIVNSKEIIQTQPSTYTISNVTENIIFTAIFEKVINVKEWNTNTSLNAKGDGTTNDAAAIRAALRASQESGKSLYFPNGIYNFYGGYIQNYYSATSLPQNAFAKTKIRIFGDGDDTVLHEPGYFNLYGSLKMENISIFKRGTKGDSTYGRELLYLRFDPLDMGTWIDLYINQIKFFGEQIGDDARFSYVSGTSSVTNLDKGINHVTFTNNAMQYFRSGLMLSCRIRGGIIDNNTLADYGNPVLSNPEDHVFMSVRGIAVGTTNAENHWIQAENVTISNNTLKRCYGMMPEDGSADDAHTLIYSIIGIGNNIKILNNHIEDHIPSTAMYSKANNLLIKGNVFINAGGTFSTICVKVNDSETDGSHIIIEGNNITHTVHPALRAAGGHNGTIRIHASRFIIRNNVIKQYDSSYDTDVNGRLRSAAAITHSTRPIISAVIEDNEIYTESRWAIMSQGLNGNISIKRNKIIQNVRAQYSDTASAMQFRAVSAASVINCEGNEFTQTFANSSRRFMTTSNAIAGSVCNISNNVITIPINMTLYYQNNGFMTINESGNDIRYV